MAINLNDYMHPNNPYKSKPPNFALLADKYPEFGQFLTKTEKGKTSLQWQNPDARRMLTELLLADDFGLTIKIPPDRLVPVVPLRLNYLLWVNDLIKQLKLEPTREIWGVDIGTGSTCIFPLLGHRQFGWKFYAIEKDRVAIESAEQNIERNGLRDHIKVECTEETTFLKDIVLRSEKEFHFCVCNPPFFANESEKWHARTDRRPLPHAANTAVMSEMVTEGGEVEFVKRIIEDSRVLQNKVRIYTTMLGKKSSLHEVKKLLSDAGVRHLAKTEFCQGNTIRWGVSWTFDNETHLEQVVSVKRDKPHKPFEWLVDRSMCKYVRDMKKFSRDLRKILEENFQIKVLVVDKHPNYVHFRLCAIENTWIHSRRKRREQKRLAAMAAAAAEKEMTTPVGDTVKQGVKRTRDSESDDNDDDGHVEKMVCATASPRLSQESLDRNLSAISSDDGHTLNEDDEMDLDNDHAAQVDMLDDTTEYALVCNLTMLSTKTGVNVKLQYMQGAVGNNDVHNLLSALKSSLTRYWNASQPVQQK